MDDNTQQIQVAMMGPTQGRQDHPAHRHTCRRQEDFTGTTVRIGAADPQTEARIQKGDDELSGSLSAGEFKPGDVQGNYGSPAFQHPGLARSSRRGCPARVPRLPGRGPRPGDAQQRPVGRRPELPCGHRPCC